MTAYLIVFICAFLSCYRTGCQKGQNMGQRSVIYHLLTYLVLWPIKGPTGDSMRSRVLCVIAVLRSQAMEKKKVGEQRQNCDADSAVVESLSSNL